MLLMIKVEQYLRQQNPVQSLRNVIILEEAHNIFANVSGRDVDVSKKISFVIRDKDGNVLLSKKKASAAPGEMESLTLKTELIHPDCGPLTVSMIQEGGSQT